MYEFMELVGHIWSTLMGAQEMAHEAVENKYAHPELAAAYYRISGDCVTHADMLMKQATDYIESARRAEHEDLPKMEAIWTADHGRLVDQMGQTKIKMEMYRS